MKLLCFTAGGRIAQTKLIDFKGTEVMVALGAQVSKT